jgi:hypothetical protein
MLSAAAEEFSSKRRVLVHVVYCGGLLWVLYAGGLSVSYGGGGRSASMIVVLLGEGHGDAFGAYMMVDVQAELYCTCIYETRVFSLLVDWAVRLNWASRRSD